MNELKNNLKGYFWGLVVCVIITMCSSCRTTKYVPVEVEKVVNHYTNTTDTIRDSIYHDVFVNQYIKGDTVFRDRTEYIYKDKWRVRDSIVIQKDSIPVPYEVEKYVEKKLSWLQKLLMWTGGLFLAVLIFAVSYYIKKKFL